MSINRIAREILALMRASVRVGVTVEKRGRRWTIVLRGETAATPGPETGPEICGSC